MGASDRSPPPSVVEKRSRAARLLLGVVVVAGLWIALWRAIGSSKPEPAREAEPPAPSDAVAAAPPPVATSTAAQSAEVAAFPRYDGPIGPQPAPTVRLYGSVLRARDGSEILGEVRLNIADEEWEERSTKTAGGFVYEIRGLHPGRWDLTASSPGFRTLEESVELDGESKDVRLDLRLQPADVVRVRIIASLGDGLSLVRDLSGLTIVGLQEDLLARIEEKKDRPLAWAFPRRIEATILATKEEPGRFLDKDDEKEQAIGRFFGGGESVLLPRGISIDGLWLDGGVPHLENGTNLAGLPEEFCGVLELSESPPAYASLLVGGFVVRSQPILPGTDEVAIALSREDLEGLPAAAHLRVLDAEGDGAPEGLGVQIGGQPSSPMVRYEQDGSITVGYLLPGPATLTIHANERDAVEESIDVQPGTTNELGTYRLQPFAKLRADVDDENGKGAAVSFNIFPLDRYEATRKPLALRFFDSNSSGALDVAHIGRGQYMLVVNDRNWAALPAIADTTIGQTGVVAIRVSKGTDVALKLRAEPPPGARLSIRTSSGLPVDGCRCRGLSPMRFRLAPGRYSLELYDGESWLASESLAVGSEPIRQYFPR